MRTDAAQPSPNLLTATPDAVPSWVDRLPPRVAVYARLGRFDRPSGTWLLFWPCLIGAFLAEPAGWWKWWPLFFVGSLAMRSAGCVYNDIVDRDLDAQVTRTANRPVASGAISVKKAWAFLLSLCLIGLGVLLLLPFQAQIVALASIFLVAGYPFMKRITWWPQAWLGLTFNWGLPVGWAAADPALRADFWVMIVAYAATIAWTLGYDSIYAAQDMEDDALAGVKSSARAMGNKLKLGVAFFLGLTWVLFTGALWLWVKNPLVLLAMAPVGLHFAWQAVTFNPNSVENSLVRFRANQFAGLLLVAPVALAAFLWAA